MGFFSKLVKKIVDNDNVPVVSQIKEVVSITCKNCGSTYFPKSRYAHRHELCNECFKSLRTKHLTNYKDAIEAIYHLSKCNYLTDKVSYLDILERKCKEMMEVEHFFKDIFGSSPSKTIELCQSDRLIYNNEITKNRKTLLKEVKDNLKIFYSKRKKPFHEFIALDIETTGLTNSHKILEISAVKVIDECTVGTFTTLVNPERKIPKKVTEITGITDDDVKDAPSIRDVMPRFIDFIKDYPLVAHNAPFDMGFLKKYAKEMDLKITNKVEDTLALSKRYFKELKEDGYGYKLSDITNYLHYYPDTFHRATSDAKSVAVIYCALLNEISE